MEFPMHQGFSVLSILCPKWSGCGLKFVGRGVVEVKWKSHIIKMMFPPLTIIEDGLTIVEDGKVIGEKAKQKILRLSLGNRMNFSYYLQK